MTTCARKKVLLMILDGWGIGRGDRADVIGSVRPQRLGEFAAKYPHAELRTDGENVGLPDGQMGNSEVGHLNIGAGRVLYQDLVKINRAVADGSIGDNPEVKALIDYCREKGCAMHVMGLLSDGGVHSLNSHMYAFLRLAKAAGLEKVYVHGFLDGRDTDPKSGEGFVKDMLAEMAKPDTAGELVSLVGRYWAMGRDKRWERVRRAYDLLVKGVGNPVSDMPDAVRVSYRQGITDEFLEPQYLTDAHGVAVGRIRPHQGAHDRTHAGGQTRFRNGALAALLLHDDALRPDLQGPARTLPEGERRQHDRRMGLRPGPQAAAHRRDRKVRPRHVLPQRRPRSPV